MLKNDSYSNFFWLASLIQRLRPDLCKLFKASEKITLPFMQWLICNGNLEYASITENEQLTSILKARVPGLGLTPLQSLVYLGRNDVQKTYPFPKKRDEFIRWFYCYGVNEHKLYRWLSKEDWILYGKFAPHQVEQYAQKFKKQQLENTITESKPFGVNLIGYAYGQLGIGEDVRMTARAMKEAHIPCCIVNFPPGNDIPQNDYSMQDMVREEGPYAVNIFCMTALETGRFFAERGKQQFSGRYNIGYWPWELSRWPDAWMDLTQLVDEVWVSSRFTYDALAPVASVPVEILPLTVELGDVAKDGRTEFDLKEDAYLFCFSFDINSTMARKNPEACLRAFQTAFPKGDEPVGLVIKAHKPAKQHKAWENLKLAAASDPRIHIVEKTFSRPELLAFYKCCDCFLSLHRAEGFGRGIAEALLLGMHVITTGYSGNMEFCEDNPQVDIIPYTLIPVGKGNYPYGEGQYWADVDIKAVANCMQKCCSSGSKRQISQKTQNYISAKTCGDRYKKRLSTIKKTLSSC